MFIPAPHGKLEASLREAEAPVLGAAVVCHPHPLHGGTMHTKAVYRTAQALSDSGYHTVRFNFRGVGASTGSYGEGIAEIEDVRTVLDWLEETYPELPLLVAGFSFGSFVGLKAAFDDDRVKALLGLGVPVQLYEFKFLDGLTKPLHVIQGEEDQFGPGPEIQEVVERLGEGVTLDRIVGADHFFNDHFEELKAAVARYGTAAIP